MAGGGIARGQSGDCGGLFLGLLLITPILTWIWAVFPQESTGPILPGICQGKGGHEQLRFLPVLSRPQKGHEPHTPSLPWGSGLGRGMCCLCSALRWGGRAGLGTQDPVGNTGESHALQLCAQLALRCPQAGAGHSPRRTGI